MEDDKKPNTYLSKSLFMRGLQCHKSLYLVKYHPDLRDEVTEEQESLFRAGHEVGKLAQQLFPGGVEIPYEENNYAGQVVKTQEAISKGTEVLYEATFSYQDIFVKVDILRKTEEGWEIYEVKSSTSVSNLYIDDTAIQYYVLTGAGLTISRASVIHINNQYVRDGDIEVGKLFSVVDITDAVKEKQQYVSESVSEMKGVLTSTTPVIDIGDQCYSPYLCDFKSHCWQHIPENSVFDLRGKGIDKFEYYRNGIVQLEDVPLGDLNDKQRMQTEAFLEKKDYLNRDQVKDFLDSLWYPLCFFDFETIFPVIPAFDGTRPYQQVSFQYSLHLLQYEGAPLLHSEYLAQPRIDHRKELLQRLLDDIPENACILAYNSSFEIMVLNNLSLQFPEFKGRIDSLIANVRDLAEPFRKRDFYSWKMNGSYSLKTVLPVIVPELTYEGMEISHGGMAMQAYFTMNETQDPDEINNIRSALLEYCKLDTLAMVKILDKLRQLNKTGR